MKVGDGQAASFFRYKAEIDVYSCYGAEVDIRLVKAGDGLAAVFPAKQRSVRDERV